MIDRKLLATDFDFVAQQLARKGYDRASVERLRELLLSRRRIAQSLDEVRRELNESSKHIGELYREGKRDEAEAAKAAVPAVKAAIAEHESAVGEIDTELDDALLFVPNLPDLDAPDGESEHDNVVREVHHHDPARYAGRTLRPHWELGEALGIYDSERAVKLSGSMFIGLKGAGAQMLRALVQLGFDLHRETYTELVVPHVVRTDTFTGTGHLPKFRDEAYQLPDDDLWLIPTGEVCLMAWHRGEMLAEAELPLRYMTYTACFRREAGSYGKDTRGLQRMHEFHKLELVKLTTAEQMHAEWERTVRDAARVLDVLGLPWRILDLCTADITFASSRTVDLEVYAPAIDKWLEVSSISMTTDFQTRRLDIRYRPEDGGKPRFACGINGSGVATPRVLAAIWENYQQDDGSIVVPEALRAYMGTDVLRP